MYKIARVFYPVLALALTLLAIFPFLAPDEANMVDALTGETATPTRTPTPINIGNFVWDDLDEDGRQDGGEPGLSGVAVQLWNSAKTNLIDSTVTGASGNYTLVAPTPGQYRVRVILPSAVDEFSPKDAAGGDDTLDSDINPSGTNLGFTDIISIASNVISITSIDAGINRFLTPTPTRTPTPINIGNFVWDDLDQDGRQDAGEPGLAGVTVQLWNSAKSALLDSDVTSASGNYTLIAQTPGQYRVRIVLPNAGDQFSPKDLAGGSDTLDSDINPSGLNLGFTDIISIASNVISITSIDGGIIRSLTPTPTRTPTPINVGNFVWDDLDEDGVQDASEPGLAGVTVQLWNSAKTNLIDSAVTGASGNYTLVAPTPGQYRVRVVLPSAGDQFSLKDNAGDTTDSDINPSGTNAGFTDVYNFASNLISITTIDAGINRFLTPTPTRTPTPINVGNFVWHDLNGDGEQDAGEPGIGGVTLQLWDSSRTILYDETTSNSTGFYALVAPNPGQYRVRAIAPSAGDSFSPKDGAGDQVDSDINTSLFSFGFTDIYNFASNLISITTIDVGFSVSNPTPTATATNTLDPSLPTATATATATPTDTPTATNTFDPSLPTETATATPTATPTDPDAEIITETPDATDAQAEIYTDTPEFDEPELNFYTDTPTPLPELPTPPATPRCDLRNFEPNDTVRASVRQEFDLFCRTLIQWGEFVYYNGGALTGYSNIGVDALIQLGIIQAVDIFSPAGQIYFEGGYVMCLAGEGTLIWLDATNAPRYPEIIGSYTVPEFPGFTCATLFTPGTLVLVEPLD